MKVWLLDGGSIVIEHTQLMWNVPGPQVRIPVYSVLIEHDDGLFLLDTGIDLDHMNRVLPFELPEQTEEQTIPAQLEQLRLRARRRDACSSTRTCTSTTSAATSSSRARASRNLIHERELAQARNHEPFEFFGYSDKSWDYEGANFETVSGDLELAKGSERATRRRVTRSATTPFLLEGGGTPMLFAMDVVVHGGRAREGHPAGLPQRPGRRRPLDRAREGSWPRSTAPTSSSRTTWRRGRATSTRPTSTSSRRSRWGSWTTGSRSSPAPRRGSARRSRTSSPTRARRSSAPTSRTARRCRRTSRRRRTSSGMVDDTVAEHGKLDVLVNVAAIVPFTAVGRHRLRRVAADHVRQPRRHVPDEPLRVRRRCARTATGASSTSPRT